MNRQELLDNLTASYGRGELVTLRLRSVNGRGPIDRTGQIIAVAPHYSSRYGIKVVMGPDRFAGEPLPLIVGLTMITGIRVGPPATLEDVDHVVHHTHEPEPDGQRVYQGGQSCARCCQFVAVETGLRRVTIVGLRPCRGSVVTRADA